MTPDNPHIGELCQRRVSPPWETHMLEGTAILPAMGNNLKRLRESRGWTLEQAAEAFGLSRGGYIKVERSERGLKTDRIAKAAEIYGIPEAEVFSQSALDASSIPVMGLISAGGRIETSSEQMSEPLFEISVPLAITDDVIGFQVSGDSMWPKYDAGDIVVAHRGGEPLEAFLGYEAIIATETGDRYLKRVIRGSEPGLYDLESYNAPPMRNHRLQWGSGIVVVVPATRWQRANGKSVTHAVKRSLIG